MASLEADASNVLSGSGGLLVADLCITSSEQSPPLCVLTCLEHIVWNTFVFFYFANFVPHKPKHTFGVFAESLRVSGRPKGAHQSLKAHWRCQLLRMPPGVVMDLEALKDKFAANS